MSLYESFDFSEGVIEVKKLNFALKDYMDGNFWLRLEEHFLQAFIPVSFFSGQGENTPGKKPAKTQSMKIQVNSGDIPFHKNVGKILQNVGSSRLTPKSAKLTC